MDRNTDFSFMKSGFNNLVLPNNGPDPDMVLFIQSLVLSFTECALITASEYVSHSGRNGITPDDIKLCLKYQTFQFLNRNDVNDKMQKWKAFINEETDEYNEDEDEDEDIDEQVNEINFLDDKIINKFKKSECKCKTCSEINNVDTKWVDWAPTTPIEMALKKVLDNDL